MISTYSFLWHPKSKRLVFIVLSILGIRMYAINWGPAIDLNNKQHHNSEKSQITLNAAGNAIIVWKEESERKDTYQIFVRTHDGLNWSEANILNKNKYEDARDPQVSFNNTGHATIAWRESIREWLKPAEKRYNTFTRIYDGKHWAEALNLNSNQGGHTFGPRIVLNTEDHAIATWHERISKYISNIFIRTYDGTNWSAASNINNNQSKEASGSCIALNTKGNAIIMWTEKNADYDEDNIFVRTYDGTNWSTAYNLNYNQSKRSYVSHVALNENGCARVIWVENYQYGRDDIYNIFTRTYDGTRWSDASKLNYKHAIYPVASVNEKGYTIIVWHEYNNQITNILAKIYDGTRWSETYNLSNDISNEANSPEVSLNEKGQAVVAWHEKNRSCYNVFARVYDGTRWSEPSNLNKDPSHEANHPQVSLNEKGQALVAWHEKDNENINHVFVRQTVLPY